MSLINIYIVALSLVICSAASAHNPSVTTSQPTESGYRLSVSVSPNTGGKTTSFHHGSHSFAMPLSNLPISDLRIFTFGNKIFNTNWTFTHSSCASCHVRDGRGQPPKKPDDIMDSMLLRLSIPGNGTNSGPKPHPHYGGQLQPFAIRSVPSEGATRVTYQLINGTYPDGTRYQLRKPHYEIKNLAFGPLGDDLMISPRVAPAVFGLGLLEAIPVSVLHAISDPNDQNNDGIRGMINYVPALDGTLTVGRFGWKANVASLIQQNAGAALGDIGLTSSLHPKQSCPPIQTKCQDAPTGGMPELSDEQLEKMTFYSQTLAPPSRRDVHHPNVKRGAQLFTDIGCAACHIPQIKTGWHPIPSLRYQEIQPFTDLLLHDMGEELADHRPDFKANGRQWRTAPLWGIGLITIVNHHSYLLHDGRARSMEEAILWHGGEAQKAKTRFMHLNAKERQLVLRFLESL
jgi:CxxC motif-containing protein (DUF1111 family)